MKNRILLILSLLLSATFSLFAQEETGEKKKTKVNIEHYDRISYNRNIGDFQRLIGNVRIRHDSALFFCDSAYFYDKTNSFDAYDNVHIIVNDSVNVYCDSLLYSGDLRFAELFDNVKLQDDSTTLLTEYMTYDRDQHLASYPNYAVTTRGDKQLVSEVGFYRDDIKELSFFDKVEVTSPKYQMFTDTLFYNTNIEKMWFWGPTTIINEENTLTGEHGYYLVDKDIAYIDKNPVMTNKTQKMVADSIYYDKGIGFAKALDRVEMIDTSYQVMLNGNYLEMWENHGFSFATDSVFATYYDEQDSLFIHSDTIFMHFDKEKEEIKQMIARRNVRFFRQDMQGKCDTLIYSMTDSILHMRVAPILWAEGSQLTGDKIDIIISNHKIDSVMQLNNAFIINQDSVEGFNQIKGTDIISKFRDGNIHRVNVEGGNAETIYWIREDDASLIGIDVSKSSNMVIEMNRNEISNIKSFKEISETMYPESELKESDRILQGFVWHEEIRPKDKADIFRKVATAPKPVENTAAESAKDPENASAEETSPTEPEKPRHRVKKPAE